MIIVGSGFCGLTIASLAKDRGLETCTILEKSRGVGGRVATRRTEKAKFDHGAQFLRARDESADLRRRFESKGLLVPWFEALGIRHVSGQGGMTSLAKDLAQDFDVKLEHKVLRLSKEASGWAVELENHGTMQSSTVVLTCPLPQSLEILKNSEIHFDQALANIGYEKALVALFEGVRSTPQIANSYGYDEPTNGDIFSIADQFAKGISQIPAWTVTMKPAFSETHFDGDETETLTLIEEAVRRHDSKFSFDSRQLKKWRYCRPTSRFSKPYFKVSDGLFLAGDAFGGSSLNGAIRSAVAVVSAI